jgi:hypothetical protein
MSSKSSDHKDPGKIQGATVLGPGHFPIGSMQSRAAARLRLQKTAEVGKGSAGCICFPEDEQPFFRTSEERDLAAGVQCPLHGKRFTPRFHLFVAAWLWENCAQAIVENKNRMESRFRQAIRYTSIIISFLATRVPIIPANVGVVATRKCRINCNETLSPP